MWKLHRPNFLAVQKVKKNQKQKKQRKKSREKRNQQKTTAAGIKNKHRFGKRCLLGAERLSHDLHQAFRFIKPVAAVCEELLTV